MKAKPGKAPAARLSAPAPPESERWPAGLHDRWTIPGVCIFLAVITLAVFGQTVRYEFVNYDDDFYVYDNSAVKSGLTLKSISWAFTFRYPYYWQPLGLLSHILDCQLYGLAPAGHHLTNVLLHATAAVLLFLVLRQMTGALWRSAFVAAVFAIHPLRVESVAWVSERKDMLHGVFFMLTIGAYVRYARRPWSLARYLAVVLLFVFGLMSKPTLMTLPFVLLLLDYWPLKRFVPLATPGDVSGTKSTGWRSYRPVVIRMIVEKLPLFMLSAASCMQAAIGNSPAFGGNKSLSIILRISNAMVSYVAYIWQMICPVKLAVLYPLPVEGLPLGEVIGAVILLVFISTALFLLRQRHPCYLVGWLWYLGMLVPTIGFIQAGAQARADRYTYLPQIGLYLLLTWAAADLCAGWRHRRVMLGGCSTIILISLIFCARAQTSYWRNSESLWTHTLACTSDNFVGDNNLGEVLLKKGSVNEAIAQFQKALQIEPDFAEARNNLGNALLRKGSLDEAIAHYQRALQIKPDYAEARNNLGNALLQKGKVDEAIAYYQRALQIKPDSAEAHNNLGEALLKKGNVDEAISHYQRALQIKPDNVEAQYNLGNALLQKGSVDEAIAHYQRALQIKPDCVEASYNLGNVLLQKGKVDEAISHYQRALETDANFAEAHNNLGNALFQRGKVDEAIAHFQKALQIKPDYAEASYNLGEALLKKGSVGEAISHYQRALQIKPDYAAARNNLAWVLATCPQASLRNGNKAVELAQRANQLTGDGNPVVLHTLAAAYAEAGRFPEAVEAAQRALQLAEMQSNPALADAIRSQLKLYQAGIPFHLH
jgi:tetratricopeptide (TPR) repeat protein